MTDPERYLREHHAKRGVFGDYGGQIGPLMLSTNYRILAATVEFLAAVVLFGGASWQVLALSVFNGVTEWIAATLLVFIGVAAIHVVLIEVYSAGIREVAELRPNNIIRAREARIYDQSTGY